jgi:tetratricopeptide (TPR) repeat protein
MLRKTAAPDSAEQVTGSQTESGNSTGLADAIEPTRGQLPGAFADASFLTDSELAARRTILICISLAILTVATFWQVTGNGFVNFDDPNYVTENGRVLAGLNWDNVKWAFSTDYFGNWHPITWLSHMLDVQLFGLNPGWHHLHSVFLHAGSVVLLFLALLRMSRVTWPSAFVAALFAIHPLRVESVAWVAERKDVLSVFFAMLSLWAYAHYVQSPTSKVLSLGTDAPRTTPHASRFTFHSSCYYVLSLLCFALALMSKAMMVTLPFVFLLLDYWPLRRFQLATLRSQPSHLRRLVWEKAPFLAMSAASTVLGFSLLRHAGAIAEAPASGVWDRLANTGYGYLGYLSKMVWPVNLVLPYPRPAQVSAGELLLIATIIAMGSIGALLLLRRRPYVAVGWFWFLGGLLPVSGVFRLGPQAMADSYTYFPCIGFFIALTWSLADAVGQWRWRPAAGGCLAAAVLTACILATNRQLAYWRDSERLFQHALAASRGNYAAHTGLSFELFKQGKVDEAIKECKTAVQLDPRYDPAHSALGRYFAEKKDYESAIAHCETAIKLHPGDLKARNNLGNVLFLEGRYAVAKTQFAEVLRLDPNHTDAHNNLALTCQKLDQTAEAIAQFRQAIQLRPGFAAALNNLAWILATSPEPQFRNGSEAVRLATEACDSTQFAQPNMLGTLAAAYAEAGQFHEAIALAEQAQERAGTGQNPLQDRLGAMIASFSAGHPYRTK